MAESLISIKLDTKVLYLILNSINLTNILLSINIMEVKQIC